MKKRNFSDINKAYKKNGFLASKGVIDEILGRDPRSSDGLAARYLRARGHEAGWHGSINFELAKKDYRHLIVEAHRFGSNGLLGFARVLYKENRAENFEEIKRLCEEAIDMDGNIKAKILLGFAYETFKKDYARASTHYFSSFLRGSKWGLGFYSSAKIRSGKPFVGLLSKFFFHALYPIFGLWDRSKSAIY
ncbi:hypothetical protein GCM10027285_13720 [Oleiagrimonas citrea]|jgi:hypothetical protein|uniref:Sel1 repeat family protein n=1 Tax=Oleiagrimonas citrea TaxID=1665687 RepID=A0A846ZR96_9GAMM|nr:hypothetical protein [Oleiagrimonas citrea]NKZ40130.1 hypothetical protein [Oleiagrimonas citrea]